MATTNASKEQRLSGWWGWLVLAAIVVMVNLLVGRFLWRADWTEEQLYTLADGTREMVGALDRDVTLKFFFSRSLEDVPIPIKQYAQRAEELLREIALHSDGRIAVETIDPRPDTDEEDWARRYGVQSSPAGPMGMPFYLGVAAISGANEAALPVLSPGQEPQLEYNLVRLIAEVTRTESATIGIMSALPVMSGAAMPGAGPNAPRTWLFVSELRQLYDVEPVALNVAAIPEQIDLLMVIQPREIQPETVYAIDQFVLRGGRVLAFLDPWSVADQMLTQTAPMTPQTQTVAGFAPLLEAWGYSLDLESLVGDPAYATALGGGMGRAVYNPVWLSLRPEALNAEEVSTALIENLLLPGAGYFEGAPAEGLEATVLMQSSDESGRIPAGLARLSDDGAAGSLEPFEAGRTLALRLQGRFRTAFPEGAPRAAPEDGRGDPMAGHVAVAEEDGVVVLVADSDLLFDRFAAQGINVFGQTMFQPINDNLPLVINLAEQLAGDKGLIGLRSRGSFARPFDRVQALERQAEERWRAEEQRLQDRMMEVQRMIDEIQRRQTPGQALILTAEQRQEVDAFNEELFETRRALQDVRRNLRRDIEQLGVRVKALHMAGVPLAVGLFGVVWIWRRRRAG